MQTIQDFNRRNINLHGNLVKEVLPEYFQTEYPSLVAFLEGYYEYVDSDETTSIINDLFTIRDIEHASVNQLDQIFKEIAGGASRDYFQNPREALRMFANFYRVKGSRYSDEGFFRAFFQETVEIEFPKKDMFIVSESVIGSESLKFIQNNALYQVFSILVRSSIPIVRWRDLYRQFVHPAGFFIGGEVVLELTPGENLFGAGDMPEVVALSPDQLAITVEGQAAAVFGQSSFEVLGRIPDGLDSDTQETRTRIGIDISRYATMPVSELIASYGRIAPSPDGILDPNSPTFDEDSGRIPGVIRFSNTVETIDFDRFEDYNDSIN